MPDNTLNEKLMKAVEEHDVIGVKKYLADGADPNYARTWGEDDTRQPTTPLRMVVFRISDSFLEDADLKQFAQITQLLLHYGAHGKPALELAELRYGKYDPNLPNGPFMDVVRLVANSITKQQ